MAEREDSTTNPIDSLRAAMATDPRDWSVNKTDAWLWAIIMGWDEALPEVAARHGWTIGDASRLFELHEAFCRAEANIV